MTDHPELVRNKAGQWVWSERGEAMFPGTQVTSVEPVGPGHAVFFTPGQSYAAAARHIRAFVDPPGARRARVRWFRWAKRYLKLVRWMGLE